MGALLADSRPRWRPAAPPICVIATDPVVLIGTATLLLDVVFIATLLATRTATRTDPLVVLRGE